MPKPELPVLTLRLIVLGLSPRAARKLAVLLRRVEGRDEQLDKILKEIEAQL